MAPIPLKIIEITTNAGINLGLIKAIPIIPKKYNSPPPIIKAAKNVINPVPLLLDIV